MAEPRSMPFEVREPDGTACARINRPRHAAMAALDLGAGATVMYEHPSDGTRGTVWTNPGDIAAGYDAARDVDQAAQAIVDALYRLHADASDEAGAEGGAQ